MDSRYEAHQNMDKQKLVEIVQAMIEGRFDLIEGCRTIHSSWNILELPADEMYYFFSAVDSETDFIPKGNVRARCSNEFLERSDRLENDYLENTSERIKEACRDLIERL